MHPAKAGLPKQKTSACLFPPIDSLTDNQSSYLLARWGQHKVHVI